MTEPSPSSGIGRFVGLVLLVIGGLWMTASGLCSVGLLGQMIIDGADIREIMSIVPMIVLVGGISAAIGFAFYAVGRIMRPKS